MQIFFEIYTPLEERAHQIALSDTCCLHFPYVVWIFYNKQENMHAKTPGTNCAVGNHGKEFV